MGKELRKTGIDIIGNVSWGTHFCQFYQTPEDLIDILVPYFKAGLENNEFCMWITAEPLNAKKAKASLKKIVRNLDDYIEKGQIEILDYSQWYTKSGKFDTDEVLDSWVKKENQALERGFDGLRLSGNTFWLEDKDWRSFTEYEKTINNIIGNYKMLAVCSYSLDKCGATEIMDVIANHQFALIKRENRWEIIESFERKQSEEALRESEGKLNSMLQSIGDHMIMIDKDLNIIWANEVAKKIFGNDIIGKKCYEAYRQRKEPCEPYPCLTLKAFQDGKVHEHDTQVIDKDGKTLYFHCTANVALRDEEGKPTGVIEICKDITERKQTEEALKLFRALIEQSNDTIEVIDPETGRFFDVNEKGCADLGYSREEFLSLRVFDIYPSMDPSSYTGVVKELRKAGFWRMESLHLRKDRTTFPVELNLSYVQLDRDYIVTVVRDITERKRAEETLRKTRDHLEGLIDFANAPIIVWDPEYRITRFNHAFERLTGYEAREVLGKDLSMLFPEASRDETISNIRHTLSGQYWESVEIPILRKDGNIRIVLWSSASIYSKDSTSLMATIAQGQDITARKQLEKQLVQSQKMEAIGTLAGGVAHDFNNILTIITGNAELMLMTADKDEPLRKGIEEIKIAGERAAALTRQLLAFSRKQIIQPKILDLNELLIGIKKMLVRLIGEDIEILMIPESALWQVEADPGQMEQVIMNLAINAKDAMPNGGKLTIQTANMELDKNYFVEHGIVEEQPGSYVMLAVSDTGSGMDEETQKHIFEPFYSTKERGKGTGLGLSTVYGIVKQNGGFVWVYSEPGQGSTFKIYLPRVKEGVKAEEKEQIPVENLVGSETVLIVEDDGLLRNFAQKALQQYGYRVLTAENGEDALRISKDYEGPIDLIVTDVVMPKMSGKETADRLQPLYPQMKVIYMSGYTDNAIVHHGVLALGLNFLQKPFSPEGLAFKVREVLDK